MSEPVSNAAIEDVLSSIRRLVSDDNRTEQAETAVVEAVEKPARLVLTPSLRVAEKVSEARENTAEDAQGSTAESTEESTAENTPEDAPDAPKEFSVEDLSFLRSTWQDDTTSHTDTDTGAENPSDADITDTDVPVESDFGAALEDIAREQAADDDTSAAPTETKAPWGDPSATLFGAANVEILTDPVHIPDTVQDDADAPRSGGEHEDDWTSTDPEAVAVLTTEPSEPSQEAPLSERIEALESVIAQSGEQWEPDGDVGDEYAGIPTEPMAWRDVEDDPDSGADVSEDFIADAAPVIDADIETLVLNEDTSGSDFEPDVAAAPETAPEPDREATDDHHASATEGATGQDDQQTAHDTYDAQGGSFADANPDWVADGDDPLDVLTSEETFLDEESLRELVADIVRQELQGALGERITRNVRKLVRREIHRALAAQELE